MHLGCPAANAVARNFSEIERVPMSESEFGSDAAFPEDAFGIVVQDGRPVLQRPRAVAFVYGGKIRPQPSLPYGRWKREVRSAA